MLKVAVARSPHRYPLSGGPVMTGYSSTSSSRTSHVAAHRSTFDHRAGARQRTGQRQAPRNVVSVRAHHINAVTSTIITQRDVRASRQALPI